MDDGKNQKSTPVVIIKDLPVAYPHTHMYNTIPSNIQYSESWIGLLEEPERSWY